LYSTNHYIVSMVNPVVLPFLRSGGSRRGRIAGAAGRVGIELAREVLNSYRQQVQRYGSDYPRLSWMVNGLHSLIDQDYRGDINIVPAVRFYNPMKVLSHITEDEMISLMKAGEAAAWPEIRAIDTCTKISRVLDDILERFERGDLKPIRAARRRPKRPAKAPRKAKAKKTPAKSAREAADVSTADEDKGEPGTPTVAAA
jgi:NTE family protein